MEWVAAGLPLVTAAACTAAFFLAGRESKTDPTTPPSGGPLPQEIPQSEPESFFPTQEILLEWRTASPSAAPPSSLPIRYLAAPPMPTTQSSEAEPTSAPTTDSTNSDLEELQEVSAQPPIWLSHWASNSQPKWLSGSDTAQLQRVSGAVPLAIAANPAWSVWWAPGHASLRHSSASAYSTGRSSHRAPIEPQLGYLPPWARGRRDA